MPRRRLSLLALPLAVTLGLATQACNRDPASKVQGRWGVDVEAMVTPENVGDRLKGLADDAAKAEMMKIRDEASRILLDVGKDHLVVDVGVDRQEVAYTFRPGENGRFFLDTDDGKGAKDALEGSLDGDRLRLNWGGTELALVRR